MHSFFQLLLIIISKKKGEDQDGTFLKKEEKIVAKSYSSLVSYFHCIWILRGCRCFCSSMQ